MKVGVLKEIKEKECRVALTPTGTHALVRHGHTVLVEAGAGTGSGFSDKAYQKAGAQLVSADSAWDTELVLKVKEPLEQEYDRLREQMLFTYFHLSGVTAKLTETLLKQKTL